MGGGDRGGGDRGVIQGVGFPCPSLLVRSWGSPGLRGTPGPGPGVCPSVWVGVLGALVPVGSWCWVVGSRFPCSPR